MPNPSSVPSIVTVGNLLTIEKERRYGVPDSEGGSGYVNCVHADGTFDIKFTISGAVEKNVQPSRIVDSNPLSTSARRRSSIDDAATGPSLLSPNYVRPPRGPSPTTVATDVSTITANNTSTLGQNNFQSLTIHQVLQQCTDWDPKYSLNKKHPIIDMLEWGKKRQPPGWARCHDAKVGGDNSVKSDKKQLTEEQNRLLVEVKKATDTYARSLDLAATNGVKGQGPIPLLQHAFGVGKTKVKDCVKLYHQKNGDTKRKKRSDTGRTLVNSDKKRKQECTALNYFMKLKRKQHSGEVFSNGELKLSYENLSEADRLRCVQGAAQMKTMLENIEGEVKRVLRHTNGSISWERLAVQIAGGEKNVQPIGADALSRWVMGTDGFRYMETQTLPQCASERTKQIRMKWTIEFHLFWEGAKMVAQKVQVLYTNIDEKWFYSLVIRRHGKVVPELGVSPYHHRIHHKNSVDKLLVICAVGYAPIDNDPRSGGLGYKIQMSRAGGKVKAKKNTYKRVYRPDGTFHYPQIEENLIREKDKEYFDNWEITGSREEKNGVKKFSLKKWIEEVYTPRLLEVAQQIESDTGKRVVIRDSWDNATPHIEKGLRTAIKERNDGHGWLWVTQPPNSPLTNACDAGFFPALAKVVTGMQGLNNRSLYLSTERLWELLQSAWNEYPVEKIARLFVHQTQVAAAILQCNGGDDFVKERNGLSYGVRKVSQPLMEGDEDYEPDLATLEAPTRKVVGVKVVEAIEGVDVDKVKQLKYSLPDVTEYNIGQYLDLDELQIIAGDFGDTDYDNFTAEQKERYNKFGEAFEVLSAIEYPNDDE